MTTQRTPRLPLAASSVPVTEVMARPVVTVDPDMELLELMRLFVTAGIGGAPVVEAGGTPIGVVSKTDLLRELYDQSGGAATLDSVDEPALEEEASLEGTASTCRARDIMTERPVVVREDASLAYAAAVMARDHLHRVFVVDGAGGISGVVSSSDIVHWLAREDEGLLG